MRIPPSESELLLKKEASAPAAEFAKYKKLCDTFGECYLKTIAECRTKGYLISFIDEHEKEVKKAMDFNYTDRRDFDIYMDHFETQVRAEGEAKGGNLVR